MMLQDWLGIVATVATVIAAIYEVLSYHRPNGAVTRKAPNKAAPLAPKQRSRIIPITAVIIAWTAVAFNYYDRHYWIGDLSAETPLSAENARIELIPQPFWKDADKSLYMNFGITNAGKSTALGMIRYALPELSNRDLDPDLIDAYFIMAKAKLKGVKSADSDEYPPGPTGQFFSVPSTMAGVQFGSDQNYEAAKNGKLPIFVFAFVLERYRDATLNAGKFIYTERCVYLFAGAVHNCDRGHNRSYVSN